MRFSPKSERQIQEERFPLVKPGKYHFEVMDGEEKVSQKGNPMLVLRLKLLDSSLNPIASVTDYIMESVPHKLRHVAYSCGMGDSYEKGELLAKSFIGRTGTADIGIQKDKTGQYPDKNSVMDYVVDTSATPLVNGGGINGEWDQEPPPWAVN